MGSRQRSELMALLEPAVESLGYELVDLETNFSGRHRVLRLYIDRLPGDRSPEDRRADDGAPGTTAAVAAPDGAQEGGITLEDCERVSQQVSGILDVEDPIPGEYELEVSSPGLDRKLTKAAHYDRFAGRRVRGQLKAAVEGRRRVSGVLVGRSGDRITVRLDDDGEMTVQMDDVEFMRLVPEIKGAGRIRSQGGQKA